MYNKNNTALYGHTKRCYTDTHKLNQLKQYIVKHIIKQITTHKSIQYQTHKNDTVQHGFIQTHTSMIYACTVQNSVIQTYTRWYSTLQRYTSKKNRVQHIVIQTHTKQYSKKQRYIQTARHYGGVDRPNKKKFFVRTN